MSISHGTNYEQKSLKDLIDRFEVSKKISIDTLEIIDKRLPKNIKKHIEEKYQDFGIVLNDIRELSTTAHEELAEILREMKSGIKENHPRRLLVLGNEFDIKNEELGKVWHNNFKYTHQDPNFGQLEAIYAKTRDNVITLSNLNDAAIRLRDFIGSSTRSKIIRIEKIYFNDTAACLKINDLADISMPVFGNEHYLCRAMFKKLVNEPVDWSIIYEEITGSETKDAKKDAKMTLDTCNRINKRIGSIMGGETKLFLWEKQTVKRLH